jgi:hypothetical protein
MMNTRQLTLIAQAALTSLALLGCDKSDGEGANGNASEPRESASGTAQTPQGTTPSPTPTPTRDPQALVVSGNTIAAVQPVAIPQVVVAVAPHDGTIPATGPTINAAPPAVIAQINHIAAAPPAGAPNFDTTQLQEAAAQLQQLGLQTQQQINAPAVALEEDPARATLQMGQVAEQAEQQLAVGLEELAQDLAATEQAIAEGAVQLEQQLAVLNTRIAEEIAMAQQTTGVLGAPIESRPVCGRLLTCCPAYTELLNIQGFPAMGPTAVQTCELAAQMGTDESCQSAITSILNEIRPHHLAAPEGCE